LACPYNPENCERHATFDHENTGATPYFRKLLDRFGGCAVETGKYLMNEEPPRNYGGVGPVRSIEMQIAQDCYETVFPEECIVEAKTRLMGDSVDVIRRAKDHSPIACDCPNCDAS
jgi:hypothetical protein